MSLKNAGVVLGFFICTLSAFFSVLIGYPTFYISSSIWRAWTDIYKGAFGIILSTTVWLTGGPVAKIYSPHQNLHFKVKNGLLISALSPRAVLIANHQIYSDWMYLWWFAYTADLHRAMVITLKKSLRDIPVFGWAMRWFKFLFLSRKWAEDELHIQQTTENLTKDVHWPVWLCLFPEGTVINSNTMTKTEDYAVKKGISKKVVPKHLLLPRVKGLQAILKGLKGTIPVLYDITMVYEPATVGTESAESYYSLRRTFLEGKGPRVVKMYIREFPMSLVPYDKSDEVFTSWLYDRWVEKDQIFEDLVAGNLESDLRVTVPIRSNSLWELYQCFNVPITLLVLTHLLYKILKW